jgi:hypothetical protein
VGAQGSATLAFGAFPGASDASVDVTGLTGLVTTSLVEAWLVPKATADHSADEHLAEELAVFAYYVADGTLRIFGRNNAPSYPQRGDNGFKIYGNWNVGWVWN